MLNVAASIFILPILAGAGVTQDLELQNGRTIEETKIHRLVKIDIKPGSDPNSINLKSKGVVAIAILSDQFFDAKNVVIESIVFAGTSPLRGKLENIDNDGDVDLILHFDTRFLQLNSNDTQVVLTGKLKTNTLIKGVDSIRIISTQQNGIFSRLLASVWYFVQSLVHGIFP